MYTVYDNADRPIFTQDGIQRDKGEWSFNIPVVFGRTVLSGTCKNALNYTAGLLDVVVVKATFSIRAVMNSTARINFIQLTVSPANRPK